MLDVLLPSQRRRMEALQMMGAATPEDLYKMTPENVPANTSRKVLCPLLSGLLSATQPHWTPLKMAPLTVGSRSTRSTSSTRGGQSTTWSLEDAQIKVDLCEVDAFLADRVYQMIRSNACSSASPASARP